jgi:hypothetical protein
MNVFMPCLDFTKLSPLQKNYNFWLGTPANILTKSVVISSIG